MLTLFFALFSAQEAVVSDALQIVENERRYVARELHDGVAQTTQQLILQASLCRKLLERRRLDMLAEELSSLETRAQHASNQVRELITDLRPPRAELAVPFVEWVRAEIDAHLTRGGPPTEFELQTRKPIPDLPGEARVALVRILQEALLNARKHARARQMEVTLSMDDGTLRLTVADDGQGFSPSALRTRPLDQGGAGLQVMRSRAVALGGQFRVETGLGQGTRVEASIPVK
jgi:two-component system sensor histidine kinase DegS